MSRNLFYTFEIRRLDSSSNKWKHLKVIPKMLQASVCVPTVLYSFLNYQSTFLIQESASKIELLNYQFKTKTSYFQSTKIKIDGKIKQIIPTSLAKDHPFYLLTEKGMVYRVNRRNHIGVIRSVWYMNQSVSSMKRDLSTCYFLLTNGKLYRELNNGSMCRANDFVITNFFTNQLTKTLFYVLKNDKKLYAEGKNIFGQLGTGFKSSGEEHCLVENLKMDTSDIADIQTSGQHSVLLTKQGKLYSCGLSTWNGHFSEQLFFTEIPTLENQIIIQVAMNSNFTLIINESNELFVWGLNEKPKQIQLPNLYDTGILKAFLSNRILLLYNSHVPSRESLVQDFKLFFQKNQFTDLVLPCGVKAHQGLIEARTKCKIDQIQLLLKDQSKEKIISFLEWVYYDEINNNNWELIEMAFSSNNLSFVKHGNSLQNDILYLFDDEKSKDFYILIKNNKNNNESPQTNQKSNRRNKKNRRKNKRKKKRKKKRKEKRKQEGLMLKIENDNNNNDNNNKNKNVNFNENDKEEKKNTELCEKEEIFEKINVHKFLLLARSGLYRSLFEFTSDNNSQQEKKLNQIEDFSDKSKESLMILIKYLYTGKFYFSEINNPLKVYEDLYDSLQYYQLNENSDIIYKLNKMKSKFNILY
ncbi:btk-binding protein-related [Anaeramoeba flamelloides]|uniref:Btk-binding protein-related n=1 Tax=Anaeramoeba flamelloides TaxID=1746091 RepID=A0AAV7YL05_9EUKA|nr:btk-binding protein-related [Anaeramoeba flamelloides]